MGGRQVSSRGLRRWTGTESTPRPTRSPHRARRQAQGTRSSFLLAPTRPALGRPPPRADSRLSSAYSSPSPHETTTYKPATHAALSFPSSTDSVLADGSALALIEGSLPVGDDDQDGWPFESTRNDDLMATPSTSRFSRPRYPTPSPPPRLAASPMTKRLSASVPLPQRPPPPLARATNPPAASPR